MLSKLLKHEFRATGRIMLPLYAAALVMAIFANVSIRFSENESPMALNVLFTILFSAFIICLVAVGVMSVVIMIRRFRQNLLGTEGYLMFTLPTTPAKLVLSKSIVSVVWFAASLIVSVLAILIAVLSAPDWQEVLNLLREIVTHMHLAKTEIVRNGILFCVEVIIFSALGCASFCMSVYAAISVGYSFNRHKTLLSFVAYFVFHIVFQTVGINVLQNISLPNINELSEVHLLIWCAVAVEVLIAAVYFVVTNYMLRNRLNLE